MVGLGAQIAARKFMIGIAFQLYDPAIADVRLDSAPVGAVQSARCVNDFVHDFLYPRLELVHPNSGNGQIKFVKGSLLPCFQTGQLDSIWYA